MNGAKGDVLGTHCQKLKRDAKGEVFMTHGR